MVVGDNGVLKQAQNAKIKTEKAKDEELRGLTAAEAAGNLEMTWHKEKGEDGEEIKVPVPAGFAVSQVEGENRVDDGLVVIDKNGNEYVWIEVPASIYDSAKNNMDYENIESDMKKYAQSYNGNYSDEWISDDLMGLTKEQYDDLKKSMLKSVYDNKGFFIGRYEAGTEIPRSSNSDELVTPVIKKDAYPYNLISCKQAQEKSKELSTGENTSSLMFGIQWDLACKFIEEKGYLKDGTKVTKDLLTDSRIWGNYKDISFNVERGKYSTNPLDATLWKDVNNYDKPKDSCVLLTTGATERNRVLNIYDFAGNLGEFTLGNSERDSYPLSGRGRNYKGEGNNCRSCFSWICIS